MNFLRLPMQHWPDYIEPDIQEAVKILLNLDSSQFSAVSARLSQISETDENGEDVEAFLLQILDKVRSMSPSYS